MVWVMGNQFNSDDQWINKLKEIGVKKENISIVNLSGYK